MRDGKSYGAIVFSPNYSQAFDRRFDFFEMMAGDQDQIIKDSTIEFHADATGISENRIANSDESLF